MSERKPLFSKSRLETTERADGALAWTFGSLYGLHEEVVGVGLTFISPTALANIHLPLHTRSGLFLSRGKGYLLVTILASTDTGALKFKDLRAGVAKISQKTGEVGLMEFGTRFEVPSTLNRLSNQKKEDSCLLR